MTKGEYRPGWQPRTGWRWWVHLGANETRLMYPKVPLPALDVMVAGLRELAVEIGMALNPTITALVAAMAEMVGPSGYPKSSRPDNNRARRGDRIRGAGDNVGTTQRRNP